VTVSARIALGGICRPPEAIANLCPAALGVSEPKSTPRLALSVGEACTALGMSWDLWSDQVEPSVRIVRPGRRKLVAVQDLERWPYTRGERALEKRRGRR
jgi:hypothetical protein